MSSFPNRSTENGNTHSRAWFWSRPSRTRPHVPARASPLSGPDHDHVLDAPSYVWPPKQSKTHSRAWFRSRPSRTRPHVPARASPLSLPGSSTFTFLATSSLPSRAAENGETSSPAWFWSCPSRARPMFQHVPLHFPADPDPRMPPPPSLKMRQEMTGTASKLAEGYLAVGLPGAPWLHQHCHLEEVLQNLSRPSRQHGEKKQRTAWQSPP